MSIEVVDFGSFGLGKPEPSAIEMDRLSAEILRAFSDIGFVYLKNTGIEDQKVTEVMHICKKFFTLPSDIKQQYARSMVDTENIDHGWVAAEIESLNPTRPGDLKEAFNVSTLSSRIKWPSVNHKPEFRECVESFFKTCQLLAVRMLKVIALGLGLEGDFFLNKHKYVGCNQNQTSLRSLYYPSIHKPSVKGQQIRCGEHSDYGTFTLLFQDECGGLEVMHKSGQFVAAPHIPNTVLLNIGDLLQKWTSDRLISTVHRVLLPHSDDKMCKSRQSLAFFVHPDNDVMVTCCDGSEKYPPTNSLQYLMERFDATYIM
ncbi:2-oxoglutarate-Fe(II) type oxidoreductase ppzD-like [Scyliorhinus canicula]|uniref:2-oxoglutarate-Fe(II) type oxidoreductase ppzD-like n=1 Tax=Scyliorhinus canicula TaxID=7830 RepID=UPI0018F4CE05|nr:2-oxoglutarate-Fe(II) type oxidoreductase ppzD-like [Scyliorhinus canicula]